MKKITTYTGTVNGQAVEVQISEPASLAAHLVESLKKVPTYAGYTAQIATVVALFALLLAL